MRGISELMEVLKSGPSTPSQLPPSSSHTISTHAITAQLNGLASRVGEGTDFPGIEVEPTTTPTPDASSNHDPVVPVNDTKQIDSSISNNLELSPSRPRAHSDQRSDRVGSTGKSSRSDSASFPFNKMKNMLEVNMGISQSSGSLAGSEEDGSGSHKSPSLSPSHSPRVQRRGQRSAAAVPRPPKRGAGTSLSSSNSSLASNPERNSAEISEHTLVYCVRMYMYIYMYLCCYTLVTVLCVHE